MPRVVENQQAKRNKDTMHTGPNFLCRHHRPSTASGVQVPRGENDTQFLGLKEGLIGERKKAENSKEATLDGESTQKNKTEDVCYVRGKVKREREERSFSCRHTASATKALEMNVSWAKESCSGTNLGAADLPRHMKHI